MGRLRRGGEGRRVQSATAAAADLAEFVVVRAIHLGRRIGVYRMVVSRDSRRGSLHRARGALFDSLRARHCHRNALLLLFGAAHRDEHGWNEGWLQCRAHRELRLLRRKRISRERDVVD